MGKGKGKSKSIFNFTPQGNKKPRVQSTGFINAITGTTNTTSKRQTSKKVHNSKGKPSHGQGKSF